MSLTDNVIQTIKNTQYHNSDYEALKDALKMYHQLIDEGKLIKRQNNVQNMYKVHSYKSNSGTIKY